MKIGRFVLYILSSQFLVLMISSQDKQFGGVEGWWGLFNQEYVFCGEMIVISPLTHSDDSRTLKSGITVPNCQSP